MITPTALTELGRTPQGGLKPFRTLAVVESTKDELASFRGALAAALTIFRDRFTIEVEGLQWSYGGHLYWFRRCRTRQEWAFIQGTRPEAIAVELERRAWLPDFMDECRVKF
jgi:hypothetical protein